MKGHIRKRKEGVYEINWELPRGADAERRRCSATVYGTEEDAELKLREQIREVEQRQNALAVGGPGAVRMEEWLSEWYQAEVLRDCKVPTQERYEGIIKNDLVPEIGEVLLVELSPRHVDQVQTKLLARGLDAGTVRLVRTVLSGACDRAVRLEIIDRNVVALVRAPRIRRKEIMPPPVDTVHRILQVAADEEHPLALFVWMLTYTGMRFGELWCLRWENVDLLLNDVRVVETARRTHHSGILISAPKTQKAVRTIELDSATGEKLDGVKRSRRSVVATEGSLHSLVFPASGGGLVPDNTMRYQLRRLCERVGAPRLRFHDFRHFHATMLLQRGMNPVVISRRLGHSSVTTTLEIYGHVMSGWQREAAEAFAEEMERLR